CSRSRAVAGKRYGRYAATRTVRRRNACTMPLPVGDGGAMAYPSGLPSTARDQALADAAWAPAASGQASAAAGGGGAGDRRGAVGRARGGGRQVWRRGGPGACIAASPASTLIAPWLTRPTTRFGVNLGAVAPAADPLSAWVARPADGGVVGRRRVCEGMGGSF